ncbi:MAG TPA: homogentisate 1,2-dioxygenase [Candidatus Thermoplasmatota archaeon]|nr:homogentisate 1,2-dioxygenase [Candidatus Thermoplasmatota archaeon]
MLDYHRLGTVPAKHHIQLKRPTADPAADGCPVYYEHCITRKGFDGAYSIAYRRNNPAMEVGSRPAQLADTFQPANDAASQPLRRRHLVTPGLAGKGTLWESLRVVAGNEDVRLGTSQPTVADSGLVANGDGDLLLFLHEGSGVLSSELGDVELRRHDYVWIPRGLIHRIRFAKGPVHVLWMECRSGLEIPANFRNPTGQLRMDAPYGHRDFRRPHALSAADEKDGTKEGFVVLLKRGDRLTERVLPHHPFDVVGWDGTAYPVAFNIHDYQPKTGLVHLPPPIHTTFLGGKGSFVICSFVPRKLDYHPEAIPCPYPHSSVDCDELLWYVEGQFASRKGVGPASITLHPAGIPHAPQPGRYEASFGAVQTDEMAVMVDTFKPLHVTAWGAKAEDPAYHDSWVAGHGGSAGKGGNYVD